MRRPFRSLKKRAAMGADKWNSRDSRALPAEALSALAVLLNMAERGVLWLQKFLLIIIALLAKPDGSGDRPIALQPFVVRGHGRIRKGIGQAWCKARAGHLDDAISSSSALRASPFQAFQ